MLSGRTGGDLLTVSLALGSEMLVLAGIAGDREQAHAMLLDKLNSGEGMEKLRQLIRAQGGDPRVCDDVDLLPQPALKRCITVNASGYIAAMDTTALGNAAQRMGAGRIRKSDVIDPAVGYILPVRIGDHVQPGDTLAELWARDEATADAAEQAIRAAITISDVPVCRPELIHRRFGSEEVQA